MRGLIRSFIAVVLTFVLVVSGGTVGGGVSGVAETTLTDGGAEPTTLADVDPTLLDSEGVVEVLLQLEEAAVTPGTSREAAVAQLKAHAEQTQAPVVDAAEQYDQVTVVGTYWLTNTVLLEVDTDAVPVETLASIPGVQRLLPNAAVSIPRPQPAEGAPVVTETTRTTYGVSRINAPDVWASYGTTGAGVTVAVLDTGVDAEHPDITLYTDDPSDPTYPGGWAEFDSRGDPIQGSTPSDVHGHGTHVSGTVAGGSASGVHIGVAPGVRLLHGKVLSDFGFGTTSQIIGGMEWAVEQDADVVSMSLGGTGANPVYISSVRNAEAAGVLVVAAIGNSGEGTSGSPGNVYETFSVGSSDVNDRISTFSGGQVVQTDTFWGPGTATQYGWPASYVVPDVAAPGDAVVSADTNGGYVAFSGTSMATPHVSGAAALLIASVDRELSPAELREALLESATKRTGVAANEPDVRYGAGVVDALAAAEYLEESTLVVADEPNSDFGTATPLGYDDSIVVELDEADVDVFAVGLLEATQFEVRFDRSTDTGVTVVALYGPDEELITAEYVGSGAPVALSGNATATGVYYVQVVAIHGGVGRYTVAVVPEGTPEPAPPVSDPPAPPVELDPNEPNDALANATALASGQPVTGEISTVADEDWFRIQSTGGSIVEVRRPVGVGEETLLLRLHNTAGTPVFVRPVSTQFLVFGIPAGTFYVSVVPDAGTGTGPYAIQFVGGSQDEVEPNDAPGNATAIDPNVARTGDVSGTDVDYYVVQATGETADLQFLRPSAGDALVVTVLDDQLVPLAPPMTVEANDDLRAQVPVVAGTIYVSVASKDGSTGGEYLFAYLGEESAILGAPASADGEAVPMTMPDGTNETPTDESGDERAAAVWVAAASATRAVVTSDVSAAVTLDAV